MLARRIVSELYHILLQREPDQRGHAVFVNKLLRGCPVVQLVREIIQSDEYRCLSKPAADFVRDLYCTVLRRDIGPGDCIDTWLELEAVSGREATFEAFIATPEATMSHCTKNFIEVAA